jgi:hypothetical protein
LTSTLDGSHWSDSRLGSFTPLGKTPRQPLDRRLVGPQCRSGHCGEENNLAFGWHDYMRELINISDGSYFLEDVDDGAN